jgi:hypothetical protein
VRENAPEPGVTVSSEAYRWLRDAYGPDAKLPRPDYHHTLAAVRGVRYALAHLPPGVDRNRLLVIIEEIQDTPVDTTEDAVAYAACFATWEAIGVGGTAIPEFQGQHLVFPE